MVYCVRAFIKQSTMRTAIVRVSGFASIFIVAILAIFSFVQPAIAGTEMPISLNPATQRYPVIDGNRIVWSDNRNGNWDIYMYDLSTNTETQITNDSVDQTHPDISGKRIVWLNWWGSGSSYNVDVHMYDLLTQTQSRIPFSGTSTTWSPDIAGTELFPRISGNRIVWEGTTYSNAISVYDIATGSMTQVSSQTGYSRKMHPDISGDKVVWEDWRGGNPEIYMYDFSAGRETHITSNANNLKSDPRQIYPAIDGNKIVWMDNRNPNRSYDVYLYDLSTQVETRLSTNDITWAYYPAISGDKIVWWSFASGISGIDMHDLATQIRTRITPNNANVQTPGSSAVSNGRIVWQDYRTGYADIYMYDFNPNVAPIAQISPISTVTLAQSATFYGSGSSDADGTIVSYHWDFGDSTSGDGVTATHTYTTAGTYQVTLTITDDDGATATATISVLVNAPPIAVIASISTVTFGGATAFDGSASSDPDGIVAGYQWDFGDGTTSNGVTATHTYAVAGTYSVVLTVTDNNGAIATATTTARIDAPPIARIAPVSTIILGEAITFDGSGSSDADGTIAGYQWNFGDGMTGTGSSTTHTYTAAGTYPVTLTVTDNDGATGTATTTVTVQTTTQAIDVLMDVVQAMNLAQGISNSLDSKLQNVADALNAANAGNRGDAINKLQAFINAVQAQSGNKLTVAQANQLIVAAQRIIAAIP